MTAPFAKHEARAKEIVATMSLVDKVGQMFHSMAFVSDPTGPNGFLDSLTVEQQIREKRITHFNAIGAGGSAEDMAKWQNHIQAIATDAGLTVPVTISTDPRNHFTNNPGAAMMAGPFSQWPETLGLAAIGDPELVRQFADTARQEYLAVGIRAALHPQIDLATEPRWSRAAGTFGESAELTAKMAVPYIQGFQGGDALNEASVSTMTKHFPGGGPQKDGEDPHFAYGREQVYPGGKFDYHLEPFKAAIAAGTAQMMPYYGMPIGLPGIEEVAFGFNKAILTDLLRNQLGFEGVICTDWGILTDAAIMGQMWPARAWGVEHLTPMRRMVKAIDAGVDQFGGEYCTEIMLEAISEGLISEARIDQSVVRLIAQKLTLGLFENALVDASKANAIAGNAEFRAAGMAAQARSLTVLKNEVLPLAKGVKVYVEGISTDALAGYATVVATPEEADFALVRAEAPFELRGEGFEAFFHAGSLDFPQDKVDHFNSLSAKVSTVLGIYLDRPAILTPIVDGLASVVADYGAADSAWLSVVFGEAKAEGKLPFDLPRSMAAVEASREDVPFDTENPLFKFGHGLRL
ncbi:MAG: glycoside hydrolase family 3 C-terminal domain-containing protein [Actinomycetales bacterium]|nr:glycoside hydrolase family 3 C-terminal domain-containing protein [Actinomycetales bacterium]